MDAPSGWIMFNGPDEVAIYNQVLGKPATGNVSFSRREFARFVRWFLKPQRTSRQ